jgi:hypothetical protein
MRGVSAVSGRLLYVRDSHELAEMVDDIAKAGSHSAPTVCGQDGKALRTAVEQKLSVLADG